MAVSAVLAFVAACTSSGAGGRAIIITQRDDGCTPASVDVTPGEKLKLVITNESSSDPYEVEGIDGTRFEEMRVPQGKTRTPGYTVPNSGTVQKIKCYVPGGATTIIELRTGAVTSETPGTGGEATAAVDSGGGESAGARTASAGAAGKTPDTTVAVGLSSYEVSADAREAPAGVVRFIATNASTSDTHELVVARRQPDGGLDTLGEVENLAPGSGGTVTLALGPGSYVLACLIANGEAGSTVDHYQQGMRTDFTVR
ncbi:MAG: hypothetical protein HYX50_04445 [Chloroflexi bacterium]|nr:hypothetical protein [Chloroflexota bacterium]